MLFMWKKRHTDTDHEWYPAKYVIIQGSSADEINVDVAKLVSYINRSDNIDGRKVKVIIASSVASEGVDFKRIRQVHILDPLWNYSKIDQIIGRGVRNKSHIDLPPEKRNVEIYKYSEANPLYLKGKEKYTETVSEYIYGRAEDKDKKIKIIELLLKKLSINCFIQKHNNIRTIRRNIKIENSSGKLINFTTGDKPFSRDCNYQKRCDYKCEWEPSDKITKLINIWS